MRLLPLALEDAAAAAARDPFPARSVASRARDGPPPTAARAPPRFTPDSLEEASTADGASVSSWRNVANICYLDHECAPRPPTRRRAARARLTPLPSPSPSPLRSAECTSAMRNANEPMAVERLVQSTAGNQVWPLPATDADAAAAPGAPRLRRGGAGCAQPVFKREVVNGRGVVRFTRGNVAGTAGQFLQMETTAASGTAGFTANPFTSNSPRLARAIAALPPRHRRAPTAPRAERSGAAAGNRFTVLVVARVRQATGDTGVQVRPRPVARARAALALACPWPTRGAGGTGLRGSWTSRRRRGTRRRRRCGCTRTP